MVAPMQVIYILDPNFYDFFMSLVTVLLTTISGYTDLTGILTISSTRITSFTTNPSAYLTPIMRP